MEVVTDSSTDIKKKKEKKRSALQDVEKEFVNSGWVAV